MTNSVICLLFLITDEYSYGPGSDCVCGGMGAQKSMLNNRITSLTCIHSEARIKRGAERRRVEMKSEAIKERSVAYLFKKWRPRGEEGRKAMVVVVVGVR